MTPVRHIFLLLLAALILATVLAVLGVAQQARVIHMGYRIERLQAQRAFLAENSRQLLCEISALSHPARIEEEIGRLDVTLLDPVELTQASANEGLSRHLASRRISLAAPRRSDTLSGTSR